MWKESAGGVEVRWNESVSDGGSEEVWNVNVRSRVCVCVGIDKFEVCGHFLSLHGTLLCPLLGSLT